MNELSKKRNPGWALVDKSERLIRMGPDACLAIFDTRAAARRVASRTTNVIVVPVDISKASD